MRSQRHHECMAFVKKLHAGQTDKGGSPYHHHLYEVANNAKAFCQQLKIDDENFIYDCMEIGLLHDSMEDCDLSFEVIQEKYGDEIANGVKLMTKQASNIHHSKDNQGVFDFGYVAYLTNLYQHYLNKESYAIKAMIVKLSDLKSNLNYQRLGVLSINELTQKQLTNLLKYHQAHQALSSIIFDDHHISIDEFEQQLASLKLPNHIDIEELKNAIHKIID